MVVPLFLFLFSISGLCVCPIDELVVGNWPGECVAMRVAFGPGETVVARWLASLQRSERLEACVCSSIWWHRERAAARCGARGQLDFFAIQRNRASVAVCCRGGGATMIS